MVRKSPKIPEPGERFDRLVVLRKGEDYIDLKSGKRKSRYWCQCDCKSPEKLIRGADLTSGRVRSCGCLHREISSETAKTKISHGKKYNKYDLSGEYGVGYTSNGEEFYFDLEDYDKIKDICWYINNKGYVVGHVCGSNKKQVRMHQIVFPTENGYIADHIISYRKNDNRKSNLRKATQQQNCMNRKISRNNTSGYPGVSFNKRRNKWVAYICIDNKLYYLGGFKYKKDAIAARKKAEKEKFGEFRYKGGIDCEENC